MGDDDQRAGPAVEVVLDDGEGVDVQIVGGFVEQQHVGFVEQQPQELQPAPLTAGQLGDPGGQLVADEPEVLEQRVRADLPAAGQLGDSAATLDGIDDPLVAVDLLERLTQIADPQCQAPLDGARGRLQLAGEQPQHRRLAGAVDADQPDADTRPDRPVDAVEQDARRVADLETGPGADRRRPCRAVPWQSVAGQANRAAAVRWRSARWPPGCETWAWMSAPAVRAATTPAPCASGSGAAPRCPRPPASVRTRAST